eukprot:Opistho-2@19142
MSHQLACTYAALILAESGKKDAASIQAVTKAAGIPVSQGLATAFAAVAKDADFSKILASISFGGAASAAPAAASAAPAAKKEEKKAAPVEEEEDDFGMGGLF